MDDGSIRLRICGDRKHYCFEASVNGAPLTELFRASTRFLACEVAGRCFTGTVMGLYAFGGSSFRAVMDVSAFRVGSGLKTV
ncbi:MAG TPA: hypothetical protein H9717_07310 [Candidatus Eisenbergiella merdipullorum]|uniref:Beta-xylosidase C-terminal Concanavalin A-like domain-containing protein n=1 Tax=Candidatus Eisenbergiella merdipullorum TaxID=2838553 RepID=A0A9D2L115_9FIRM|nr:hypothetical protein [Candidatus Eisenbergiella merdipullorum]